MKTTLAENIDAYIAGFPEDIQKRLESMRATIRKAAPEAEEDIKYAIPTFTLNGNLSPLCCLQKSHWVLSGANRHRGIQKRNCAL